MDMLIIISGTVLGWGSSVLCRPSDKSEQSCAEPLALTSLQLLHPRSHSFTIPVSSCHGHKAGLFGQDKVLGRAPGLFTEVWKPWEITMLYWLSDQASSVWPGPAWAELAFSLREKDSCKGTLTSGMLQHDQINSIVTDSFFAQFEQD